MWSCILHIDADYIHVKHKIGREMNNIFEECGELRFKKLDITDCELPELPEDCFDFEADVVDVNPVPDLSVPAAIMAMLREAKEKHLSVMFTNEDETRALLVKDANDLNLKITVNGVPFEQI